MKLSNELQIGKAGEHLVCFDLIMQGYNAFLADQGLPFDVVVEKNNMLYKIQVKTTQTLKSLEKAQNIYRYGLRRAKGRRTIIDIDSNDFFAFVALDIREVAYLRASELITDKKTIKQTMDFKTKRVQYKGRVYSNGTVRKPEWGKYFEDYKEFRI